MSDETSRAAEKNSTVRPVSSKPEFENVEFLEESLQDPLNVLRLKLKDLSDLPEGLRVRRIVIMTDIASPDGRGLDITWSESRDESFSDTQDAVLAMLLRVQTALTE